MSVKEFAFVTGNTFPVRDALRAMGSTWSSDERGWYVPMERLEEAEELIRNAPKNEPRGKSGRKRWGR